MKRTLLFSGLLISISSLLSNCKNDSPSEQLKIGDYYQGGIVIYNNESSETVLLCDLKDLSLDYSWSGKDGEITGADKRDFEQGKWNTDRIVHYYDSCNCDSTLQAAQVCANHFTIYDGDTITGWFLPAESTMKSMYNNDSLISATALANNGSPFQHDSLSRYWTSVEFSQRNALSVYFESDGGDLAGGAFAIDKNYKCHVRPVRIAVKP